MFFFLSLVNLTFFLVPDFVVFVPLFFLDDFGAAKIII
jgi:hypothetical protein